MKRELRESYVKIMAFGMQTLLGQIWPWLYDLGHRIASISSYVMKMIIPILWGCYKDV